MFEWYRDQRRQTYVGTYDSDRDARRETEAAAKHGWVPQATAALRGGRGVAAHVLRPFGHGKEKITITFVRVHQGSRTTEVHIQATAALSRVDAVDQLTKLADLRDREVITLEEFDAMRAEIMAASVPPAAPGLTLADAAARLHIADTTLMQWIDKAGCGAGGTFTRKSYPPITVTPWRGELRIIIGP